MTIDFESDVYNVVDIVKLLIPYCSDLNGVSQFGQTPLQIALSLDVYPEGDELAMRLIKHGADVNVKDGEGQTLLHTHGSIKVLKLLIEKGADVNARDNTGVTPLFYCGSLNEAVLLIENGANVNAKDVDEKTPLHVCTYPKIARLLIEHGADVHAKDVFGRKPLEYLRTKSSDVRVARILELAMDKTND